jgi:hypothetical protein
MKLPNRWKGGPVERVNQAFFKHYKILHPTSQLTASTFFLENEMYVKCLKQCSTMNRICRGHELHSETKVADCIQHKDVIHVKCKSRRAASICPLFFFVVPLFVYQRGLTEAEHSRFDDLRRRYSLCLFEVRILELPTGPVDGYLTLNMWLPHKWNTKSSRRILQVMPTPSPL